MKIVTRWAAVILSALALVVGSGPVAEADYPTPTSSVGQHLLDIVSGWNQIFPGSVDAWELHGSAAHLAYLDSSVLTWPSMQEDLRQKMRKAGATTVGFTPVAIPYATVEAAVAALEKRYAAAFTSGALAAIYPTPGLTQRSLQVAGESAGVALLQAQLGTSYQGLPVVYRVGAQPAPAGLDVYITPGMHLLNGREWRTRCEPYSRTKRCRTEIKATTIQNASGSYVQTTGWVFNNLTYAASPRSLWKGNPLGYTVRWSAADSRQWRTECDTALTGRNACRSFVMSTFIALENGRFVQKTDWQFNNMVRFS
ncbi:hypothetical protein [Tessaracoccus sp. MC1756]|uniref:hypothetical protein n=1 Tax=Tessaracoccus sp. MC1756 TaxID=2760311 RepID=UPI00160278E9|nr:hypothetical protein [Tessaracoccus sp. MC1756]MBB1510835.1 hypothetical protein [Tessaracoccus sp. MC1756]